MPGTYRSPAETGFYHLNSRYYDPEVGRFISVDGKISGVGGDVRGYNLYAYCFNNPVNMTDPDGNWPKLFKEIGNRLKYVATMIVKTVTAPFKAAKVSVGAGIGIGVKGSVNVKGAKVEVGATASITDSVVYDKGKVDVRNTSSAKANVTFGNIVDFSIGSGKEHSFFDEKCNCSILHDPFVQQMNCAANSKIQPVEATLGGSIGAYLLLGGEIFVGVDLRALHDELINVFTEPYVSSY